MGRKVDLIKQMSKTECGLCCAAMILRYYKNYESIGSLQKQLEVGRDGINLKQLYLFMQEKNFDVKILRGGDAETIKLRNFPCIAFFDHKHYVVIERVINKRIIVCDPDLGKLRMTFDEFNNRYSGFLLEFKPNADFKQAPKSKESPWYKVLKMIFEHKVLMFSVLILMGISYIFYLYVPQFIQKMIDDVGVNFASGFEKYLVIIILLFFGYLAINMLRSFRLLVFNICIGWFLEGWTFKKLLKLPYKYFDIRSTGDILYRLVSTNGVKELLATQVIEGIVDLGAVIVLSIYLFQKSVSLAVICWVITTFCLVFILLMQPHMSKSMNDEIIERTKVQEKETEVLSTIMTIKMTAMEEQIYESWESLYKNLVEKFKKRMNIHNFYSGMTQNLQLFAPVIVLFICLVFCVEGKMTFGEAIAFQSISSTFFSLVISITSAYTQYIVASTYLDRVNEIWVTEEDKVNKHGISKELKGEIELEHISFQYAKCSPLVLHDVNLKIEGGTKVAIVGMSGSGKSTLSKILCGLYEPTQGVLKYDGIPFKDYNRKLLSSFLGIVPQDVMLFNKSIYSNIVMEKENITIEQVEEACRYACIYDEIKSMPMGFDTIVSEMGMNLSGGQRQRILLARVLLAKPKVIIMDEATSSIDNISEKKISDYLYTQGCTRIVIAHRLSTILDSDVIFVMDKGKLIAKGVHDELMKNCEKYKELYTSAEL